MRSAPSRFSLSIRALLSISRPRFWSYLGGTYLVGYVFGASSSSALATPTFIAHLLYFLVPANIFLYGINDLFDQDTDVRNPKKGQHEHRLRVAERQTLALAVAGSALLGVVLMALTPSWLERTFFGAYLVLGAAYSTPPPRLKARPVLDFSSNALYAMPGFLGFVQASGELPPALALLGAGAWTGAMHLYSAIPDIEADCDAGVRTTATYLGPRGSLSLCALLWLVAALCAWNLSPGHLVGLLAFIYPAIPAALLFSRSDIQRVASIYWRFPWLNAGLGFVLFVIAVMRWFD